MEHGKQLITVLISLLIAVSPLADCSFGYAEGGGGAGGDEWLAVNDEASMVAAFKAYCRSRNLDTTFTYSNGAPSDLAKAIINYNYQDIEKACALAGTDIDTVSAGLWYKIDNNNTLKFFYNMSAMSLLNQLYSALLTEHNIQENSNNVLYSGESYQDDAGNIGFIYYANLTSSTNNTFNKKGTYYIYVGAQLRNMAPSSITIPLRNQSVSYQVKNSTLQNSNITYVGSSTNNFVYRNGGTNLPTENIDGGLILLRTANEVPQYKSLYLCTLCNFYMTENNVKTLRNWTNQLVKVTDGTCDPVTINGSQGDFNTPPENKSMEVQTDSDTINNYITNNDSHDTYNYYNDDNPPSYTNPYDNNPTGGTIDGDGSINFQMPDLNIDWNLDLGNNPPFPFSIPFDIINFMQAFNTEPVTPHIEETITIANMDIVIDIDLEWLDDVAAYFRTFILLSYIIGLIVATRALFHIY